VGVAVASIACAAVTSITIAAVVRIASAALIFFVYFPHTSFPDTNVCYLHFISWLLCRRLLCRASCHSYPNTFTRTSNSSGNSRLVIDRTFHTWHCYIFA
jgi:hypothetical protein